MLVGELMTTEIFVVTYHKDAEWLAWCLKSINKFATGFSGVTVVAPHSDQDVIFPKCEEYGATLKGFDEPEGKGMLAHMAVNCMADGFVESDFALHMDSDCIFTEPVTPEDYFVDEKPVLLIEEYEHFREVHPGVYNWKRCTEAALGWECKYETMRRHPAVHNRMVYPVVRACVESFTRKIFFDWAIQGRNEFPQDWSEFNLIGAVALKHFKDDYHWWDLGNQPWPHSKLIQSWSHGGLDRPRDVLPFIGETPRQIYEKILA